MKNFTIKEEIFKLVYLPDYAKYLLSNKLKEFVIVGIRFSREADLPLLKPLSKFSEQELVDLSLESNRQILEALSNNKIAEHIIENGKKWASNSLGFIDKDDIAAEDLTLAFYIRRKIFTYFLDAFTKNVVLQKLIISEVDFYTTQEELFTYNIFLKMQHEKFVLINKDLEFHKELLLYSQQTNDLTPFLLNYIDEDKSELTPEYKELFEIDTVTTLDKFIDWVHPDDRPMFISKMETAYKQGGNYEVEYRYIKSKEKHIWSKGFIIAENGKPLFIRGIAKDFTCNQDFIKSKNEFHLK